MTRCLARQEETSSAIPVVIQVAVPANSHHDREDGVWSSIFQDLIYPRYVKYRVHYRSVDARFITFSAPKLYVLPSS
jgi:hypothetical protein